MGKQPKPRKDPLNIRAYTILGLTVWTLFLGTLLNWSIDLIENMALERAYIYTKVGFDKDVVYRRWVSEHGGVYVRVDSTTPPSPYLSHISDRDIVIDSGLKLTLMNPAYMTRQVYELEKEISEIQGHITSLNPIRKENAADEWETKVLQEFEKGVTEFSEVGTINGEDYFRYMKPFITEKSCLKCHAHQGYKVNDIRGGVSVSYPMDQVYILIESDIRNQYYSYGLIWILGLSILVISYFFLRKSDNKRLAAEEDLLIMNSQLEDRVQSRTENLQQEIAERQKAEAKIIESQQRFETLFNFGADAVFVHPYVESGFKNFIEVNNIACLMFGYSKEEFLKLSPANIASQPDIKKRGDKKERTNLKESKNRIFDARMIKKSGEVFPVEISSTVFDYQEQKFIMSVVRDITVRKEIEKKLERNTGLIKGLIQTVPDLIWLKNINGEYLLCNPVFERLFGAKESDIIGKTDYDFVDKELADFFRKNDAIALEKGKPTSNEEFITFSDGGYQGWFETTKAPMYKKDGTVLGVLGIARDISYRKQAKEELTIEKEFTEKIINTSTAIIIGLDKNHLIQIFNKGAEKVTGYSEEDMLGKDWFKIFFPKELLKEMNKVWTTAWGIQSHAYENPILIKTGEERMISWQSTGFYEGEDSTKHLLISIGEDVTDRKKAENELRESQTFNQTLLDTSPDIIYVYDIIDRKNIYSNEGIMKILGYSAEEILTIGDNLLPDLMHPDDFANYIKNILPLYQKAVDKEIIEHEYRMKHKSGLWTWLWTKESIFLRLPDGTPKQIFGLSSDITERKLAEKELKKHREHLEELVKDRTLELQDKNKDLARVNKLFVGRELRMKELKDEIEKLKGNDK